MKFFQFLSRPFVVFVERYYPDPFVFAILLTFVACLLALALTPSGLVATVDAWGAGLPSLLAFTAQISITLVAAHALAHTDAVQRLLLHVGGLPQTEFQAYALVALFSGFSALIAWSLGLIVGAIVARQVALGARQRGIAVHYPLLVASAYAGFCVWHMGYSGSAPLFVATPGHTLEAQIGVIPVTDTTFTSTNMLLALLSVAVIAIVCPLMRPDKEKVVELDPAILQQTPTEDSDLGAPETLTFAQRIDNSRALNLSLAMLLGAYLFYWFYSRGFNLNLNIVNWSFLGLGLLLARSPLHYARLIVDASAIIGLIILQYPFYAGIMGVMQGTGLGSVISDWFTAISTPDTLPFFAFLAGGLVNMFVPSGGGQWAVQGPIFIEAAQNMGVEPALVVMGIAYGDQWTNAIQPFWTIPLLAIAGLHMRQIMGYTFVIFLVTFFLFGGGLLFLY